MRPKPIPDEPSGKIVLLSVSRFDPRKNVHLAIEALARLQAMIPADVFGRVQLILAGHYDAALPEQRALMRDLVERAARLHVNQHVTFAISPTSKERDQLIARSRCVVYTPSAEHFGYVPLEAMAAGRPVVAVNHGGPTETVIDGATGRLCAATPEAFAEALSEIVMRLDVAQRFGLAARERVQRDFSREAFGRRLWAVVEPLLRDSSTRSGRES